jgi:hypothetical protein
MNERIRELEGDANDYADAHWERKCPQWHEFYTEKFAELIIKECVEICDNTISDLDGWYAACKQIREHFGVEE